VNGSATNGDLFLQQIYEAIVKYPLTSHSDMVDCSSPSLARHLGTRRLFSFIGFVDFRTMPPYLD